VNEGVVLLDDRVTGLAQKRLTRGAGLVGAGQSRRDQMGWRSSQTIRIQTKNRRKPYGSS
jgi:hypothetical protein